MVCEPPQFCKNSDKTEIMRLLDAMSRVLTV